ncbi:MAG TPA: hypothetical protein VF476_00965 [Chitinophagaceae bacterium]
MKKIAFLVLLIALFTGAFSQQVSQSASFAEKDYLKKSRSQKTWAWILTGTGVAVVTIGLLTQDYVDAITGIAEEKNSASPIVYVVGGSCITGGIILFAASAKNKKKAMSGSVILKMERTAIAFENSPVLKTYPAAGIRINL